MSENILPKDGRTIYIGKVLEEAKAAEFYQELLNEVAWKNDEVIIFGKRIITSRKTAWYGDRDFIYQYSA